MVDGTLGRDAGCSGSGIVEGSERYGTWYELDVPGDTDDLAEGNWAGSPDIPTWYQRIEQYASHGVPAAIAAAAAQHKSVSHANVTTVAQAWAAIGSSYPVLICSNIAFEAARNDEGVIAMTGHDWPHCMVISSRRTSTKYGRLYLVHQSWSWTGRLAPITSTSPRGASGSGKRPGPDPRLPVGPPHRGARLLDVRRGMRASSLAATNCRSGSRTRPKRQVQSIEPPADRRS